MCLNCHEIVNPSRYFKLNSGQPLYLNVPCGHCSECIVQYRSEWKNRAFFESLDCTSKGGFVLFMTLTYKNGCLPHLSDFVNVPSEFDFPCFCRNDVTLFWKRLRTDLSRAGFDCNDKLRYLLVCEYGKDIRYSKRPHYHILLFCTILDLSPALLSQFVSNAWCYYDIDGVRHPIGITDGLPYKSSSYVNNNVCFSDNVKRVVGYVSKYLTKDFNYDFLCQKRLNLIKDFDFGLFQQSIPFVKPFHCQSKGFGWSYVMDHYSIDYILRYQSIPVINVKGIIQHVSLPMSLVRKYFYSYSRENNRVVWTASPELIDYKVACSKKTIDKLASRVFSIIHNYHDSYRLAEYILFVRNRLLNNFVSIRDTLKDSYNVTDGFRNYCAFDRKFMNRSCLTKLDFGSSIDGFISDVILDRVSSVIDMCDNSFIDLNDFAKNCFNSDIELLYQKYKSLIDLKDDGQLEVLKLQHRLIDIHKSKCL